MCTGEVEQMINYRWPTLKVIQLFRYSRTFFIRSVNETLLVLKLRLR